MCSLTIIESFGGSGKTPKPHSLGWPDGGHHHDKQMCDGQVGKMEEQRGTSMVELDLFVFFFFLFKNIFFLFLWSRGYKGGHGRIGK